MNSQFIPINFAVSAFEFNYQKYASLWRRVEDLNLHTARYDGERISDPLQYQLCLTLQIKLLGTEGIEPPIAACPT